VYVVQAEARRTRKHNIFVDAVGVLFAPVYIGPRRRGSCGTLIRLDEREIVGGVARFRPVDRETYLGSLWFSSLAGSGGVRDPDDEYKQEKYVGRSRARSNNGDGVHVYRNGKTNVFGDNSPGINYSPGWLSSRCPA